MWSKKHKSDLKSKIEAAKQEAAVKLATMEASKLCEFDFKANPILEKIPEQILQKDSIEKGFFLIDKLPQTEFRRYGDGVIDAIHDTFVAHLAKRLTELGLRFSYIYVGCNVAIKVRIR